MNSIPKAVISSHRVLRRTTIIILLRFWLGGLFIYASLHKIRDLGQFRDAIVNYEIVPHWLINITAIVLPWVEFWIGMFLILGIFVRSCVIIQGLLLITFILAIALNITRGNEFYCGCFGNDNSSGMNYRHIVFNALWLSMAIMLFILERRRFSHRILRGFYCRKQEKI
ncbi:MAG: MauE/DoxX family redox-associated membrane protein [Nitrospirota bacterium]